ncbi:hypothetical protein D3C73_533680 [compost metagenome]
MIETGIDLRNADAKRGGNAEHRADNGKDIDGVSDRAIDPAFEQRIQTRTDGQRQVITVAKIGERQSNHGIYRPGVNTPMKEGDGHRFAHRLDRARFGRRWRHEVRHRLADGVKHQPDAHARGKQHRNP